MTTPPLRIGVHGATGRMGTLVRAGVEAAPDLALVWACGRGGLAGLGAAERADVIIDFSTPDGLQLLLEVASEEGIPVVSGTTGGEIPMVTEIAFLHAANFSIGVAVLARLVAEAARVLPGFDAEIIEIHHSAKRDAPSGTALRLAAALQGGRDGAGDFVNGRGGLRAPGSIGVHAVRAGDVIGEHTVLLAGAGERLELRHIASQRSVFASGAIAAARWLRGRPPGRYSIEDVIEDMLERRTG